MGTILSISIFSGIMVPISKFGVKCCGGHSGHNHHSGTKNLEGSEKEQISKNALEQ